MGGRRPTPTAIKELKGNPGRRPINDAEPETTPGAPERPKGMSRAANREWKSITAELLAMGVLSTVDGKALAAYCQAYALWEQSQKDIDKYGTIVEEVSFKGDLRIVHIKANPAISTQLNAAKVMKAFLIEFGLTPASRAKLKIEKKPEADPMDEFMKGKKTQEQKREQTLEEEAADIPEKLLQ